MWPAATVQEFNAALAAVQGLRAMVSIEHESHELTTNQVQSDACIDYAEVRRKKRT